MPRSRLGSCEGLAQGVGITGPEETKLYAHGLPFDPAYGARESAVFGLTLEPNDQHDRCTESGRRRCINVHPAHAEVAADSGRRGPICLVKLDGKVNSFAEMTSLFVHVHSFGTVGLVSGSMDQVKREGPAIIVPESRKARQGAAYPTVYRWDASATPGRSSQVTRPRSHERSFMVRSYARRECHLTPALRSLHDRGATRFDRFSIDVGAV